MMHNPDIHRYSRPSRVPLSLSLCFASSRCACSFLFVLVSVFLIHRAPAVMALGSSCWRAVGSAGIMDREVSNVTADWQLTGGEKRDAIAALCASQGAWHAPERSRALCFSGSWEEPVLILVSRCWKAVFLMWKCQLVYFAFMSEFADMPLTLSMREWKAC